jgi:NAD dependent epimerase/dehydratase family enzyme
MTTVVVAGASGFMGRYLVQRFEAEGARVRTIGRSDPGARWSDPGAVRAAVDGADLVLNLAGRSVNCRYDRRNRAEILRSRVDTTRMLGDVIADTAAPPALWLNSSTATIYRHADDRPMTEADGELGTGFSVDVARAWEAAFFERELPATRRVALRTAIVLGRGSVMPPLVRLVRFGLGGPQLDGPWIPTPGRRRAGTYHENRHTHGRQRFSWIHIEDVARAIRFLHDRPNLAGVVNLSAPNPTDNATFMRTLRQVLGMPIGLPAARWMLELGAIAIRTETELVLKSRWVVPERLEEAGFDFRYPELEPALRQILRR